MLNAITPTITQEMKYGRNMMDWETLRKCLFRISVRKIATAIWLTVLMIMNNTLYNTVLRVTVHACPDLKKNLKFSIPFQGLPQMPPA